MILDFHEAKRVADATGWEAYEGTWLTVYQCNLEAQAMAAVRRVSDVASGDRCGNCLYAAARRDSLTCSFECEVAMHNAGHGRAP